MTNFVVMTIQQAQYNINPITNNNMKKRTPKEHERHLNALYTDSFSESQAVEQFIYLTSKNRSQRTTEANIRNHHANHQLGTLLRKFDPIAFYTSIND